MSPKIRAAIIGDYRAGMSSTTVAAKWGTSSNTVLRYARAAGVLRSHANARLVAKERRERAHEAEIALAGGHWSPNSRGVQVWQPCFFDSIQTCNINHQENSNAA